MIAVIAILAAVLIPTFVNVTAKAKESAALSTAKNAHTEFLVDALSAEGYENGEVTVVYHKDTGKYYSFTVKDGEFNTTPDVSKTATTPTYTTTYKYTLEGYDYITIYTDYEVTPGADSIVTLVTDSNTDDNS